MTAHPALTIGSLFSGYGGLDLAVEDAIRARTVWHSEIDPAASRVLAARWPGVPNLGDITAIDWAGVPRVDILTGGFPCQDVSHAGRRVGLGPGTRSGLWSRMAEAIRQLRPALVVAENVRGLLSAPADCDVEPCSWCLGDADGEPAVRALGAVLADLAELGYDAAWLGLRAADVGAPHGRFRVFVVAWPADPSDAGRGLARWDAGAPVGEAGVGPAESGRRSRGDAAADPDDVRGERSAPAAPGHGARRAAADPSGDGRDERRPEPAGFVGRPDAALGRAAAADADDDGLSGIGWVDAVERDADGRGGPHIAWGRYEPAVRRWERVIGRPAPAPTEPGRTGAARLSPLLVEWMMGLPAGWVTGVPGISRNDQLKILGNGVVPQQAAAAIRSLLAHVPGWRVAA